MREIIDGMIASYHGNRPSIQVSCEGRKSWHLKARDHRSVTPCVDILNALRKGWPDYTFNMSGPK